jgi:hypothetical protein
VHIAPLSEAFHQARNGTGTVVFSIVLSPERELIYTWAGPSTKARFVVFAPVSHNITIGSPADLNQYLIEPVKGTIKKHPAHRSGGGSLSHRQWASDGRGCGDQSGPDEPVLHGHVLPVIKGCDGKTYIVASGNYKACEA